MAPLRDTLSGLSNRSYGFISNFGIKINDTFARTTSGALGNATTGNVWTQTNGTWYSNSGAAVTATAASSYPFATTPYNQNMTATVKSAPSGSGIVFWQSGANDWWAAASSGSTSLYISSYSCNTNSCCTGSNNCTYNACCTGANYAGTPNSCCTGSNYAGTPNSCCTGSNGCSASYTCGASNNCSASATCGAANNCAYSATCGAANNCAASYTCGSGTLMCVASGNCGTTYFCNNCSPGWSGPCGGTCQRYATATKQVLTYAAGSSYYAGTYNSCCSYSVFPGAYSKCCTGSNNCSASDTCGAVAGTGYQECCTGSYSSCVSRPDCGASSYAGGYYSGAPSTCCTGANNCASSACCTGSNNCTYNAACTTTANYSSSWLWALNIIKSVAGTVSTVATSTLATTYSNTNQINAIKVTTSHTGVSAQGYSDTVLATSIGSPVTATAPSQQDGKGVGIIVTPGGTNQGNSVGPFTAQ